MTRQRHGRDIGAELARRGYAPARDPLEAARTAAAGLTRRDFLGRAAGGGLALGMPPLLAACGGGGDDDAGIPTERRTLFFNFAHEDWDATEHFLVFGGRHHPLVKVKDAPAVLARAREGNAFLRGVPDEQITHHLDDLPVPAGLAVVVYVTSNVDRAAGTWEMSSMVQIIPTSGARTALLRAQAKGPVPRSLKRQRYGLPAAQSVDDLLNESVFLDSSDHARTLVGMLPDLLCAEPGSAYHICTSHIEPQSRLRFLADTIQQLGPAKPPAQPGKPNAQGWATLTPFNDEAGQPILNSIGLRACIPDWNVDVEQNVTGLMNAVTLSVKNDETLGTDMTGLGPATPGDASSAGKMWNRVDGQASVTRSLADPPSAFPGWTLNGGSSIPGLYFKNVTAGPPDANGAVLVTVPPILNMFLRFLGAWATFYGPNGEVIPIGDLPAGTIPGTNAARSGLNKPATAFLGVVPPPYTVVGVPVFPGWLSPSILVPRSVSSMEFQFAGLGFNGSWDDPSGIIPVGGVLTGLINFAVPLLFMAAGVSNLEEGARALLPFLSAIAGELVTYVSPSFDWSAPPNASQIVALFARLLLAIVNGFAGKIVTVLVTVLAKFIGLAQVLDAIPIVGTAARAIAAIIGAIVIGESLVEIGLSAPISSVTIVGTHALNVTVTGDPNRAGDLPTPPPGYGPLYYKVTYQFDSGAIHTLDAVPLPVPLPDPKKLPIRLVVPRGGKVCVSIALYANKAGAPDGQGEFCAAKGSTGLQDNTIDTLPEIVLTEVKIPITAGTRYVHVSKTQLDGQGRHVWQADASGANAPPYIPPGGGQQRGQLGALRSITVRQNTLAHPGYLGYSWRAFSDGLLDCTVRQPGQLDQAANLNTDAGNGGLNAQNGYALSPCGLQGGGTSGVTVAYSLLSEDGRNIYFDSTTRHIRPVSLANPPAFVPPAPGQAASFGQLNLDSTRLLLHPMGFLISINNATHTLESLRMPPQPLTDVQARRTCLARVVSGKGTRPGLMTSPVAAAVSADGVVLVLEDGTEGNRLLAFDVAGNALPYFKNQKESPYWMRLAATAGFIYLDISVEFTNYIYVLAQNPDDSTDISVAIYHPTQSDTTPICVTPQVHGGAIAVDYWRSLYTLNYEVLTIGGVAGAFPPITEPSVSLWKPG